MRNYSTPTFDIKLKNKKTGEVLSDLEFDYVLVTIKSECAVIERKVMYEDVTEGLFQIELTQAETGALGTNVGVEMELNIMAGSNRIPSTIKRITLGKNLHDEVIL